MCYFLRPMINQKYEDKMCGTGPSLASVFEDDNELMEVAQSVQVCNILNLSYYYYHIGLFDKRICIS